MDWSETFSTSRTAADVLPKWPRPRDYDKAIIRIGMMRSKLEAPDAEDLGELRQWVQRFEQLGHPSVLTVAFGLSLDALIPAAIFPKNVSSPVAYTIAFADPCFSSLNRTSPF